MVAKRAAVKNPTIYSIAEACGVSPSTVSRALTRPEMVRDSVRVQILAVAQRLGYQPNLSARSLITGRFQTTGVLVPDIENPFFPPLIRAIQRSEVDLGRTLIVFDSNQSVESEQEGLRKLFRQADGVIVASPLSNSDEIIEISEGRPLVSINKLIRGIANIICDNTPALTEAVHYLYGLGHKRAAVLKGPGASEMATVRAEAVSKAGGSLGLPVTVLGPFPASYEGGVEAAAQFMRSGATAAFAFDDVTACGVIGELTRLGVRVPEERSIVGCDGVAVGAMVHPALTTIVAPFTDLGEMAVKSLHSEISADSSHQDVPNLLQGRLVIRKSTDTAWTAT